MLNCKYIQILYIFPFFSFFPFLLFRFVEYTIYAWNEMSFRASFVILIVLFFFFFINTRLLFVFPSFAVVQLVPSRKEREREREHSATRLAG